MAGVRYRLRATPRRAWLFNAGLFGLYMGTSRAVDGETFWSTVPFGVISGVLLASFMAMVLARNRPEALRELPDGDRETVVRTVHEGTTVEDARLGPAIIAYANCRHRECERTKPWVQRSAFVLLALFCAYLGVTSGMDGRSAEAGRYALLTAILLVMAFVAPRQRAGGLQRAEHAERSARALLDSPN